MFPLSEWGKKHLGKVPYIHADKADVQKKVFL